MNERIQELAKEAIANVRFWDAEKEAYDVGHDELAKFAELIWEEAYQKGYEAGFEAGFDQGYDTYGD